MRKALIGFLVLSAFLFAGLLAAQEAKGPKLTAKELQYDFGTVTEGTEVSHVFEISNTGTESLVIQRVASS